MTPVLCTFCGQAPAVWLLRSGTWKVCLSCKAIAEARMEAAAQRLDDLR